MDYSYYNKNNNNSYDLIPVTVFELHDMQVPKSSRKSSRQKGYTHFGSFMNKFDTNEEFPVDLTRVSLNIFCQFYF